MQNQVVSNALTRPVLHAFEKRTRRTTNPDIDLAKKRLKDLMQLRAKKPEKR